MGKAHPISKIAALLLLALIAILPERVTAFEPRLPGQESFLTRAAFAGGRLWMLSDAGDVSSVAEGQDRRVVETLPERVADLCVLGGRLTIVTVASDGSAWTVQERIGEAWSVRATVPSDGDGFLGMDCVSRRLTFLTTRRLVDIDAGQRHAVTLSEALRRPRGRITSIYGTPDELFVGFDAGEWGGGLSRIDRRSGAVSIVERNAGGALCGGPLVTDCDPVNGIATIPWKPGCLAIAVGLVHFAPTGRLVEVCGDQLRELYSKPYGSGSFPSTVAFFGLVSKDNMLWAMGIDGLHGIGPDGKVQIVPLPRFKSYDGVDISFDLADVVLVLTNVNRRNSVSGPAPLIVPR